jgi:hypothetical protein
MAMRGEFRGFDGCAGGEPLNAACADFLFLYIRGDPQHPRYTCTIQPQMRRLRRLF